MHISIEKTEGVVVARVSQAHPAYARDAGFDRFEMHAEDGTIVGIEFLPIVGGYRLDGLPIPERDLAYAFAGAAIEYAKTPAAWDLFGMQTTSRIQTEDRGADTGGRHQVVRLPAEWAAIGEPATV
jgi:hypothetical protein